MEHDDVTASHKGYNFGPKTAPIIGAAMAVHRELGAGFLEYTYQKALAKELQLASIPFEREVDIPVYYRGEVIDTRRADFIVGDIILEIKAVERMAPEHVAQLAMYLKATHFKVGLLMNFGAPRLQVRRVIN